MVYGLKSSRLLRNSTMLNSEVNNVVGSSFPLYTKGETVIYYKFPTTREIIVCLDLFSSANRSIKTFMDLCVSEQLEPIVRNKFGQKIGQIVRQAGAVLMEYTLIIKVTVNSYLISENHV